MVQQGRECTPPQVHQFAKSVGGLWFYCGSIAHRLSCVSQYFRHGTFTISLSLSLYLSLFDTVYFTRIGSLEETAGQGAEVTLATLSQWVPGMWTSNMLTSNIHVRQRHLFCHNCFYDPFSEIIITVCVCVFVYLFFVCVCVCIIIYMQITH